MLDYPDVTTLRYRSTRFSLAGCRFIAPLAVFVLTAVLTVCCIGFPARLSAQQSGQVWEFRTVESADLLFHGLAVVGFQGFSSLPLYDRGYAERIRAEKEARGIYPTSLDRQARSFLEAFETDSTFEILHFLPLYFRTAPPTTILEVFSETAAGAGARSANEEAGFASSVVAAVLRGPNQRRVLGEFGSALELEWDAFLSDYSGAAAAERIQALANAENRWNQQIVPAISEFLEQRNLTGGTVMVSSALGPEGRVFAGDPESTGDDIFAVTFAHHQIGLGVAAFLLKELCYPVGRSVVEALGLSGDRVSAERLSGNLAVHCGAELLDATAAGLADEYRATLLTAAATSGIPGTTFEVAYPVDTSALERLRRTLRDYQP